MDREAYLLHQVHAAKLATDISAAIVSGWLMWHRRVPAALLAGFAPAAIASALVTRRDLSALADTRRGRYVLAHMPPAAQALRLAGQVVVWRAEYEHRVAGIVAGHALVAAGWSHGLLTAARRQRSRRSASPDAGNPADAGSRRLAGQDVPHLARDLVWVPVKRRFKIASVGRGPVRGELALQLGVPPAIRVRTGR
jgi:hypothetical protein